MKKTASATQILAWQDDPGSEHGPDPVHADAPDLTSNDLKIKITGSAVAAQIYQQGTPEFRFWTTAESLRRCAHFWSRIIPGLQWHTGSTLPIKLDDGVDLNAYYDRTALAFFHKKVSGKTVYSCESPDVSTHEMGHAILDAIRPQLWDVMSGEAAAFHESFGDISAICTALQLDEFVTEVLEDTEGNLFHSSRLSRLAEQLGWAIRQVRPDAVERDCLRNAVNSFSYQPIDNLPTDAPASQLSSESHSFSRVFTSAFLLSLANMYRSAGKDPNKLKGLVDDAAKILIAGIKAAPISPDYFSQVAGHVVQAAASHGNGTYAVNFKDAFVLKGILTRDSANMMEKPVKATGMVAMAMASPKMGEHRMTISVANFGIGLDELIVVAPGEPKSMALAATAGSTVRAHVPSREASARSFVETLLKRGKVELDTHGDAKTIRHEYVHKTHKLERVDDGVMLVRDRIDCGFRTVQ